MKGFCTLEILIGSILQISVFYVIGDRLTLCRIRYMYLTCKDLLYVWWSTMCTRGSLKVIVHTARMAGLSDPCIYRIYASIESDLSYFTLYAMFCMTDSMVHREIDTKPESKIRDGWKSMWLQASCSVRTLWGQSFLTTYLGLLVEKVAQVWGMLNSLLRGVTGFK